MKKSFLNKKRSFDKKNIKKHKMNFKSLDKQNEIIEDDFYIDFTSEPEILNIGKINNISDFRIEISKDTSSKSTTIEEKSIITNYIPIVDNKITNNDFYKIKLNSYFKTEKLFINKNNIDTLRCPNNLKKFRKELSKCIPDEFNPDLGSNNLLKYLRKSENNFQQLFYLFNKSELIFRSKFGLKIAFLNLGPNTIQFYTINYLNSKKFEIFLKDNYDTEEEFFNDENNLDILNKNLIEFNPCVLNKHEMIFLPTGSLFFFKSKIESFCFCYEFMSKDLVQLQFVLESFEEIKFLKIKPIYKIYTLLLDYINLELERTELDQSFLKIAYETLKYKINKDQFYLNNLLEFHGKENVQILFEPKDVNSKFCDDCLNELFNIYALDNNVIRLGKISFKCLNCIKYHNEVNNKIIIIYYKYTQEAIKLFLDRIERKLKINQNENNNNLLIKFAMGFQHEISENYKYTNSNYSDDNKVVNLINLPIINKNTNEDILNFNMNNLTKFKDSLKDDLEDLAKIEKDCVNTFLNISVSNFTNTNTGNTLLFNHCEDSNLNFLDF